MDEVLAVGDTAFQARCYQRMQTLQDNGTALVFVSHNMQVVQRVCSRAMVLVRGEKQFEGPAAAAVAEYFRAVRGAAAVGARPTGPEAGGLQQLAMTHEAQILGVDVRTTSGSPLQVVSTGDTFEIAMHVGFREEAPQPIFACTIYNERGDLIYDTTTQWQQQPTPDFSAGDVGDDRLPDQVNLLAGMYTVKVDLAYADLSCDYGYLPNAATFVVNGGMRPEEKPTCSPRSRSECLPAGQTTPGLVNQTSKYDNTRKSVSSCRLIISLNSADAIRSVLAERSVALELIVVNDWLTHETAAVSPCLFKDPRLRVIHQANAGLSGARSTGIRAGSSTVNQLSRC